MSSELQLVIKAVGDLPPVPVVAAKVLQLLQNPQTRPEDLARTISSDQGVSARILKIANSSFYSLKRQVKTLEHAIMILGEKTLKSQVLAASLKGMGTSFGLMEKMLWEDSVGGAIAARVVALRVSGCDPEEAFLAGLFRHIGKMAMNSLDSQKYRQVVEGVYNGEGDGGEMERRYFPFSHQVIGAAVLEKWNFSENLSQAARHHEDLGVSPEDDPALFRLLSVVNLADNLCRHLGIGRRDAEPDIELEQSPGACALGLDREQVASLLEEFGRIFEKDREALLA
ncbi:MAG: HD family phosphohydrolase [Desulfuromonas sp.]|uniref:HDOD domain-containing protein n=1 Tax=Desulfuromonas sp. TaxID=892 RepID=UPI000CC52176|nr:HDOD domain-containing protein [Desulfuromonas sp.]PLX86243.1 MAG: HD family phosphohydrolase [Desulfuromonas sp.]